MNKTVLILTGLLALSGKPAGASLFGGGPFWGVNASGSATQYALTCGTCPNDITELSSSSAGGFGQTSAQVSYALAGAVSYFATGALTGPNALPTLGASAYAFVIPGALPDVTTYFYSGTADVEAVQLYQYDGLVPQDYTINYTIDGLIGGGLVTEIYGGLTIFGSGYHPGQEIQPILDFNYQGENGTGATGTSLVHLIGSVTFTALPGEQYYLSSSLFVIADSLSFAEPAVADAAHTLTTGITQGDTGALTPLGVSDVPEPSTAGLLLLGGLAGVLARRRRN